MALDFAAKARSAMTQGATANGDADNRPKAEVWANLGAVIPTVDEDGNETETFVSIPKGLPIDTMEAMVARGDNVENNQRVETGNFLLQQLQEIAADLKPGEEQVITMQVQLRRVKSQGQTGTAASGADNPMLAAAKNLRLVG